MFTGIITAVGKIKEAKASRGGLRLTVDAGKLGLRDVAVGDSIAVSGVCLTVVKKRASGFEADVSAETLACTSGLGKGTRVNLEKSLRLSDRLGGHLVSGHVDGVGMVTAVRGAGASRVIAVKAPAKLAKYIARKGSVTMNGVSLTVNDVKGTAFTVNVIPHTLAETNLGGLVARDRVNLEVDMMARYAERLKAGK
ncbi:MAG TPA: riboflavin synthase [Burkholderiales bacterium]|nr:riboflavin synthase [Burkholderiales bacterium]